MGGKVGRKVKEEPRISLSSQVGWTGPSGSKTAVLVTSVAMMEWQKQLGRKGLFWCTVPGGGYSLSWQQEHEASLAVRKQTDDISSSHKQRGQETEPGYKTSESTSKSILPPARLPLLKIPLHSQTLPSAGDQVHSDRICTPAFSWSVIETTAFQFQSRSFQSLSHLHKKNPLPALRHQRIWSQRVFSLRCATEAHAFLPQLAASHIFAWPSLWVWSSQLGWDPEGKDIIRHKHTSCLLRHLFQ